jgi:hypothetical protein
MEVSLDNYSSHCSECSMVTPMADALAAVYIIAH